MTKRSLLGLFTIVALGALFGVYVILSDFFARSSAYRLGIRFPSAAGLNSGALVYESGVVVGSVDHLELLPDYSSEVVIAVNKGVDVPSNARFLIVQPLQGDPTLRIILRSPFGKAAFVPAAPFPHELLPIAQQPLGQSTLSLPEFLAEGQSQFARIDSLLAQFQGQAPRLLSSLQHTLDSSNRLTRDADRSLLQLSSAANGSLMELNSSSRLLTAQLSQSLAIASANLIDVTERLDQSAKSGQPHIDHLLMQLDSASTQLSQSVDALHGIAADPALHENVMATARSIAATTATFAGLLQDLRKVTGDERTQAQLRDVVSHIDAASQKADSLLGSLGGKSDVEGVDRSAVPSVPVAVPVTPPSNGVVTLPVARPMPLPTAHFAPLHALSSLVGVRVRMGELSPMHRDGNGNPLVSPLLTQDRGPQADVTLVGLPHGSTSVLLGANDIGYHTTLTLAAVKHAGAATFGGGILYSRLGVTAGVDGKYVGVSTNIYDPRRGTVDVYGKIFANESHSAAIFAGQRDATRNTRRDAFGLQLSF